MHNTTKLKDGSIVDCKENFLFIGEETFTTLVRDEKRCFLCFRHIDKKTTEHVIPKWIIKSCKLDKARLMLGSGSRTRYTSYTIPCCQSCNGFLSQQYEKDISYAFSQGYHGVSAYLKSNYLNFVQWLHLIYYKTHYRDLFQRLNLDKRADSRKIGDRYDWGVMALHHAMARAPLFGTKVEESVAFTVCLAKISNPQWADLFDYNDDFRSASIYIRIGETAVIAVLNDLGLTGAAMKGRFDLPGDVSVLQSLEMFAEYVTFSESLQAKGDILYGIDEQTGRCYIRGRVSNKVFCKNPIPSVRHELFWNLAKRYRHLKLDDGTRVGSYESEILAGRMTLILFDRETYLRNLELGIDLAKH